TRSDKRRRRVVRLRARPDRLDRLPPNSTGRHGSGRAPDPSRSRCAQCGPSTQCRAEVRRSRTAVEPSCVFATRKRLADAEIAIGAVRNHRLTRLETELDTVELYRHDIRLEGHQTRYATDLGIGFAI